MKQDQHPLNLGKLLVNFQSLEFALRAFLLKTEEMSGSPFTKFKNLNELSEGDEVPENAFTNYDTLSQLIEKYNDNPKIRATGLCIDKKLVDIRDAIAHGRVSALTPSPPFRLLKFRIPKNNRTKVKFSILLTQEWYNQQLAYTQKAAITVAQALEREVAKPKRRIRSEELHGFNIRLYGLSSRDWNEDVVLDALLAD